MGSTRLDWARMSWTERYGAIHDIFGGTNSDCGADELLHLWSQIQARGLQDAYIAALASLLGMKSSVAGYTPGQIIQMMTASAADYHWPAALRAAGVEVRL